MVHTMRLRPGDRVRLLRSDVPRTGIVDAVWDELVDVGSGDDPIVDHVIYARVIFDDDDVEYHPTADLIDELRVGLYESLRPGDLIVSGNRKRTRALVIGIRHPRRGCATSIRVIVLEHGTKRTLSPTTAILFIQRTPEIE